MTNEEATSCHEIERAMEFEKERCATRNYLKRFSPSRPPEIDLIGLPSGKKLKPLIVGHADIEFHEAIIKARCISPYSSPPSSTSGT